MEIWKDIRGYDGYQVSNEGRVRSFLNNRHGVCDNFHILHPIYDKEGRPTVCLRRGNRKLISRLVAEAFIPNPSMLPLVRHMDDNPSNNNVKNLRWGTQKDNMQDCVSHGRLVGNIWPAIESKKIKVIAISIKDGRRIPFDSINEAARKLGVWPQHVCSVLKGRISQTGGWAFIYSDEEGELDA